MYLSTHNWKINYEIICHSFVIWINIDSIKHSKCICKMPRFWKLCWFCIFHPTRIRRVCRYPHWLSVQGKHQQDTKIHDWKTQCQLHRPLGNRLLWKDLRNQYVWLSWWVIVNGKIEDYGISKDLPLLYAIDDNSQYFGKMFGGK